MRKSSQNTRSALIVAGQKSLQYLPQQTNLYNDNQNLSHYQQRNFQKKQSQNLAQSQVRQIYRRPYKQPNNDESNRFKTQSSYNKYKQVSALDLKSKEPLEQYYSSIKRYQYKPPLNQQQTKKIMMKLTTFRLRKMQALVRGFLVRRLVYPPIIQEYLIAKSVLSLIESNIIYKQCSSLIMQSLTFPKYQPNQSISQMYVGLQPQIQQLVYESIISRIIRKQFMPIIQQSITSRGLLMSRPLITFGLNLRDPLEFLLYQKLMSIMREGLMEISKQGIKQHAVERRQLFILDTWIEKHNMLQNLYHEIVQQAMADSMAEYVTEDLLGQITKQAAFVVANTIYNQTVNDWYIKQTQAYKAELQELLIEGIMAEIMIQQGYGTQTLQYVQRGQRQKNKQKQIDYRHKIQQLKLDLFAKDKNRSNSPQNKQKTFQSPNKKQKQKPLQSTRQKPLQSSRQKSLQSREKQKGLQTGRQKGLQSGIQKTLQNIKQKQKVKQSGGQKQLQNVGVSKNSSGRKK